MKKLVSIFFSLLCGVLANAQFMPVPADSSVLRFPGGKERMERFASRLRACKESPDSSITIWHIGGSHVQAGWFTSRIRHNFDSLGHYPTGGRGFIFPYPLAQTNFDKSFRVGYTGEWTGSLSSRPNRKMPVQPGFGVMGIAAYTADTTASFSLRLPCGCSGIHILGSASDAPYVIAGADTLHCVKDTVFNGFVADFPAEADSILVEPRLKEGQYFMVTGILPEDGRKGVHYVSTGVNGARTTTWTERCPEFKREMTAIKPDLAILGLGINDSACPASDFKPERFKDNYRRLISLILEQSPDCLLVFITNNDSWRWSRRRMVHNDNGSSVKDAMFELAKEYDGAVWDLFSLMGGNLSAEAWREAGLMKKDRLHFTREGYEMLGDLLYGALIRECEE